MKKDVLVKISGLQVMEETGDRIEMMAPGVHYEKGGKHYLFYEDIEENSGIGTKNHIQFDEKYVEVSRGGDIHGKLIFDKGKNNQALYSTPFGEMLLEVMTKDIHLQESEDSIGLEIDYELYANNNKVSDSKIKIHISGQQEIEYI